MTEDRIASPHAGLQAVLHRLRDLNPRARRAPAFSNRQAAEHVIAVSARATGPDVNLTPVWRLDHKDLTESEIVAWSVTNGMN